MKFRGILHYSTIIFFVLTNGFRKIEQDLKMKAWSQVADWANGGNKANGGLYFLEKPTELYNDCRAQLY